VLLSRSPNTILIMAENGFHISPSPPRHGKGGSSSCSELGKPDGVHQQTEQDWLIVELARKLTTQSEQQHLGSLISPADGSRLDPSSDQFRARDWARAFYDLRFSNDKAVARVAGVAFRGLNVSGKGSPTDFQSTVGNVVLKLPSLVQQAQKIEILQDFDGLLLPGEQVCVLGPPGYVLCYYLRKRVSDKP
jgi:ATP-binding cassette subfamily G (WHITE) protein 2 (PDR)